MPRSIKGSFKMSIKYDVVVVGAGAGGISCAWNAAKYGLKTLLVEKNLHCGGLITSGLVMPVMKLNHEEINVDFYNALVKTAKDKKACITYSDGNNGWFNTELLKSVFDDLLKSVNCDVAFLSEITNISHKNTHFSFELHSELTSTLSQYIETISLVDGTGNAKIFQDLNCEILKNFGEKQSQSLRFVMANVDCKKFGNWIQEIDKDRDVTTVCEIDGQTHFSTAYTWDKGRNWALSPYFEAACKDNVLKPADTAYFQIFSIPYADGAVSFNCPRLLPPENAQNKGFLSQSELIIEGRARINRIAEFCKKYLKGFENAYISNIADMLGVRESYRICGKHIFSVEDIKSAKKPVNIALASNYPIDVHSDKKNDGGMEFTKHTWYLPLESLMSKDYENLYAVGRCLSAEFKAQAAVRTQLNCFSMGEAVAKHINMVSNKKEPAVKQAQ